MGKQYIKSTYNEHGQKLCTNCKIFKDFSEFHKRATSPDGIVTSCKSCVKEYDLKKNDPKRKMPRKYVDGKINCRECGEYFNSDNFTIRKGTNIRCNDCTIIHQHKRTVKKHGITYEQYLKMYNDQDGKCKICKSEESSYRSRLSIDHDHSCCTGNNSCGKCIRGLLCFNCNTGLGNFKDNLETLKAALEYLQN